MNFFFRFSLLTLSTVAPSALAVDFATEVQPIMKEKCFKCHSGPKSKKGIRYDDAETLANFIGDEDDDVIKPGKPDESLLIKLASLPRDDSHAMPPPQRGEGLSIPELSTIKQWIAEGAKLEGGEPTTPAPTPTTEAPKMLTWTNTEGKSLEAFFVKLDGNSVGCPGLGGSHIPHDVRHHVHPTCPVQAAQLEPLDGTDFTYRSFQLHAQPGGADIARAHLRRHDAVDLDPQTNRRTRIFPQLDQATLPARPLPRPKVSKRPSRLDTTSRGQFNSPAAKSPRAEFQKRILWLRGALPRVPATASSARSRRGRT